MCLRMKFVGIDIGGTTVKCGLFTTEGVLLEKWEIKTRTEENGKAKVYLIKNGKAVLQSITISRNIGNRTIVSDGLATGDIVVTNGFINLFDGANITIK